MHFQVTSLHFILLRLQNTKSSIHDIPFVCFVFVFLFLFCFVSIFVFWSILYFFLCFFGRILYIHVYTILVIFTCRFSSQSDGESKHKTFFFVFWSILYFFFTFFGSIFLYCFSHIHMYVFGSVRSRILQNETACFLELGEFCFVRPFHLNSPLLSV